MNQAAVVLSISAVGWAFLGCSAQPDGEADNEGAAVAVTQEALGEVGCTTLQAPPLGTALSNIANFGFPYAECASQTYWSQGFSYSSSGCPRQYIFQIQDNNAP